MWQDDSAVATVKKVWADAETYCSNDVATGGYSDWRLPNRRELVGIANYGRHNPAICSVFLYASSGEYWSYTTLASDTIDAWFVYFYSGSQYYDNKDSYYFLRCVRAG